MSSAVSPSGQSPWFSVRINARPSVLYITSAGERRELVAAILLDEDGAPHIAFSRRVERLAADLVLSSPLVDEDRPRVLAFKLLGTTVKATAWPVRYSALSELHVFIDALHDILESVLGTRVYVKVLAEPESLPGSRARRHQPSGERRQRREGPREQGQEVLKLVIEKQEEGRGENGGD